MLHSLPNYQRPDYILDHNNSMKGRLKSEMQRQRYQRMNNWDDDHGLFHIRWRFRWYISFLDVTFKLSDDYRCFWIWKSMCFLADRNPRSWKACPTPSRPLTIFEVDLTSFDSGVLKSATVEPAATTFSSSSSVFFRFFDRLPLVPLRMGY